MSGLERKQEIMRMLHQSGSVLIGELAEKFGVSSMTVRRDLASLRQDGLVTMDHGSAILNKGSLFEYSVQLKMGERAEEKEKIARRCLGYINEGDSVFLDAGTTVGELSKLINKKENILILTNSLYAANFLANDGSSKFIMCPGEYRDTSMAFIGPLTCEFISKFTIDTLFLAVEGIDENGFVYTQNVYDGMTKAALIKAAKKVICITDSSKFEKHFLYNFCTISDIDVIITDEDIPDEIRKMLISKNIEVITV